jgi:thymidylate synthase
MNILVLFTGEYGKRHLSNLQQHAPPTWRISAWRAPAILPPVIDDPLDHLPDLLPPADLVLSFAEHKGVIELIPDIVRMSGTRAVIVSVDNETWLPQGLGRQLQSWLAEPGVVCAIPKPLCSLTGHDYKITRRQRETYHSPLISEFARYFGQPDLRISVDPCHQTITGAEVHVDAVCGCARHVAARLTGLSKVEAAEKVELLHHHYPCLASMVKLDDYDHDTLMNESGRIIKENILAQFQNNQESDP